MRVQIIYFLLFTLELFVGVVLAFGLKILDEIILQKQADFDKISIEIINSIREIKNTLKSVNKILNMLKKEKIEKIRKIISQAIDFINILMLITSGKNKLKIGKFIGLNIAKAVLLGLKIYNT